MRSAGERMAGATDWALVASSRVISRALKVFMDRLTAGVGWAKRSLPTRFAPCPHARHAAWARFALPTLHHRRPQHARLADRQVHDGGEEAERDGDPPDAIVAAGRVVEEAAEPDAEERADLVGEEDEAEERRHIAGAEKDRDQLLGRGHRREPK